MRMLHEAKCCYLKIFEHIILSLLILIYFNKKYYQLDMTMTSL